MKIFAYDRFKPGVTMETIQPRNGSSRVSY